MARLSRAHNFILLLLEDRGYTEREAIVQCILIARHHACLINKPFEKLMELGLVKEDEGGLIAITARGRKRIYKPT